MLSDYHTHTRLCKHAEGDPLDYLREAEKKGLSELGVADHVPWPDGYDPGCRMFVGEADEYKKIVENLRRAAPSSIKVRMGFEIDYVPGRMEEVYENIQNWDLDYLIGSIHYTGDFGFDNPANVDRWREDGMAETVWTTYADLFLEFVRECDFDIIGHMDLPKKFSIYPDSMDYFMGRASEALAIAGEKGMSIEINTGGLRKQVRAMYPSLDILKIARRCGVSLTLGSDAHAPCEVGHAFKDALELAKAAGYDKVASYEKRKLKLHSVS